MWRWTDPAPVGPDAGAPLGLERPDPPIEARRADAGTGPTVAIRGTIAGDEDLRIDGLVDGTIELGGHTLTIGPRGRVNADISARAVVVEGRVVGNVTATERIAVGASGTVAGDLRAPALAVADGALLHGSVEMAAPPAHVRAG